MYIQYKTDTHWHVYGLTVAERLCVIVFPHRIVRINVIFEETENVNNLWKNEKMT